jgi:hypothetical protein
MNKDIFVCLQLVFFFEVSALTSNNQNVLVAVSSNNKQLINAKIKFGEM